MNLSLTEHASISSSGLFSHPLPRIIRSAPALKIASTSFLFLIPPPTARGTGYVLPDSVYYA